MLLAIEDDAQVFDVRSQAATQAESSYQIASRRYVAGGISQLAMLNVQHQQLQTALDRIPYQTAATLSVTLFRARRRMVERKASQRGDRCESFKSTTVV